MRIHLYKQFIENHPDKYIYVGELTEQSIINNFREYPWDIEGIKGEQLIEDHGTPHLLLKKGTYRLIIYRNDQKSFDITAIRGKVITKQHTSENKNTEQIEDLIKSFFRLTFKQFIDKLKPEELHRVFDLTGKISIENKQEWILESVYNIKYSKILSALLVPIFFYALSVATILISLSLFFISLLAVTIINLPTLIILINHLKQSKHQTLKFYRRNNEFKLISNQKQKLYNKENIEKLIFHHSKTSRAPWGDFDYTEFIFKDGTSFTISSFIIDSWALMDEFSYKDKEIVTEWFQTIKHN
jgi:hypothetical protein